MGHMNANAILAMNLIETMSLATVSTYKYVTYSFYKLLVCLADVDECTLNIHNCEQICKDTNGSYVCDCLTNYILHSDGHSCIPRKYART